MDLTKRQQEIFDFIKRYSAQARLSADGARHRQGRRPGVVLDGPRAPREPREGRAAAARPVQAARDRAARPARSTARRERGARRRRACRSSARSRPASRSSPRRTSRSTCRCPGSPAASDGEYVLRVRGDSMKDAGILEGDFVVVRPQETPRTARSSSRSWARRRPSSASSGGRPHPPAARERRRWSRSAPRRCAILGRVVGLFRSVAMSRRPADRIDASVRLPIRRAASTPATTACRDERERAPVAARLTLDDADRRRLGGPGRRSAPSRCPVCGGRLSPQRRADAARGRCAELRRRCPDSSRCCSRGTALRVRAPRPALALECAAPGSRVTGERSRRGKSGHHRAGWSVSRPGETRGKVPQKSHRLRPPLHVRPGRQG